jgi:hypothetical protein
MTEDMTKYHYNLGQYRNTLNHAEFRKNTPAKKKIQDEINSFIGEFEKIFLEEGEQDHVL